MFRQEHASHLPFLALSREIWVPARVVPVAAAAGDQRHVEDEVRPPCSGRRPRSMGTAQRL